MMVGRVPLGGEPPSLSLRSCVASVGENSNISSFIHRFDTFYGTALHEVKTRYVKDAARTALRWLKSLVHMVWCVFLYLWHNNLEKTAAR